MIGTATPMRAARRTSAPCSASTSIRLPCCRSISSDDRVDGGSASTYGANARRRRPGARERLRHARRPRLRAGADEQVARLLRLPDGADRQTCRAGEAGERREVDELLPERHARIGHGFGFDAGAREELADRGDPSRRHPAGGRTPRRTRCGGACPSARSRPAPRWPSRCRRRRRARVRGRRRPRPRAGCRRRSAASARWCRAARAARAAEAPCRCRRS